MFPVLGALPLLGLSICNTMSIFDSYLWYLPKTVLSIDIACPKAPILVMESQHMGEFEDRQFLSLATHYFTSTA
jgi:hypothetical protein